MQAHIPSQTWTCTVRMFIYAITVYLGCGLPANHNICRLVFTTVLTLCPPQSLPVELTDLSCGEGMSAPERTNQSYFRSSTRLATNACHSPIHPSEGPFLFATLHKSLQRVVRETHNESDRLFTLTIMSWFGWGQPQLWSFHRGTWVCVRPIMNRTSEISGKYTSIKGQRCSRRARGAMQHIRHRFCCWIICLCVCFQLVQLHHRT